MTLDVVVLGLVLIFAIWGAFTGVARQIAQYVALACAWAASVPLGRTFGPDVAARIGGALSAGTVIATVVGFIGVFIAVRIIVTAIIRRVISVGADDHTSRDRFLGLLLGGARGALLCYLTICAASFIEQNVAISGKKLAFAPKDSVIFPLIRSHNVLERQQFAGIGDLAKVTKLASDPQALERFKSNSDFANLLKDPRFKQLLDVKALRDAAGRGDTHALLQNNGVVELLRDSSIYERIERLASER